MQGADRVLWAVGRVHLGSGVWIGGPSWEHFGMGVESISGEFGAWQKPANKDIKGLWLGE